MNRRDEEFKRLKGFPRVREPKINNYFYTRGVLLSNEIKYYALEHRMIEPFNENNLKPASYYLTVGNEFSIGGVSSKLEDEPGKNEIKISPFEVAIIKTAETINLPNFIIGRWNIRVTRAYEGLLWVGGPQVDPGFVGNLCCPIYNLSDKDVIIKMHDPIAVIDFEKTTPFVENECIEFDRPKKGRILFEDYRPWSLNSGLVSHAKSRIDKFEEKITKLESVFYTSITIIAAIIAIMITALSIMVSYKPEHHFSIWLIVGVCISLGAFILSLLAFIKKFTYRIDIYDGKKSKMLKIQTRFQYFAIFIIIIYLSYPYLKEWITTLYNILKPYFS